MDIIQAMEQEQALLRDVAKLLRAYKGSLSFNGFSEEETFKLVRDYHRELQEAVHRKQ
ncbi:hypothetical protein [Salibacterium qingdaonense]|uniref:Uncharacterized protein n=1 Tax=Salibacterium qingdaonense TaxID=266892 RepID=A0A1I4Q5I1_9BACI|nr:hypothetical protein [Salibacterium qingdaonense]SFM35329.1 hypothetical protein SAMN04488054_13712 [Salibacterium qingdaonense]